MYLLFTAVSVELAVTADSRCNLFLQNVFYYFCLLRSVTSYTITVFFNLKTHRSLSGSDRNQIFIEAYTDKTDFDGNFIEDLLNNVVEDIHC